MLVSIDPDVTQGRQDKVIQDTCQVVRDVEGRQLGEVYRGSGALRPCASWRTSNDVCEWPSDSDLLEVGTSMKQLEVIQRTMFHR